MTRLRRAWAVLQGREDPMQEHLRYCLEQSSERLLEAAAVQGEAERLVASLRAEVADLQRINEPMAKDLARFISENARLRAEINLYRIERDAARENARSLERVVRTMIDNAEQVLAGDAP